MQYLLYLQPHSYFGLINSEFINCASNHPWIGWAKTTHKAGFNCLRKNGMWIQEKDWTVWVVANSHSIIFECKDYDLPRFSQAAPVQSVLSLSCRLPVMLVQTSRIWISVALIVISTNQLHLFGVCFHSLSEKKYDFNYLYKTNIRQIHIIFALPNTIFGFCFSSSVCVCVCAHSYICPSF